MKVASAGPDQVLGRVNSWESLAGDLELLYSEEQLNAVAIDLEDVRRFLLEYPDVVHEHARVIYRWAGCDFASLEDKLNFEAETRAYEVLYDFLNRSSREFWLNGFEVLSKKRWMPINLNDLMKLLYESEDSIRAVYLRRELVRSELKRGATEFLRLRNRGSILAKFPNWQVYIKNAAWCFLWANWREVLAANENLTRVFLEVAPVKYHYYQTLRGADSSTPELPLEFVEAMAGKLFGELGRLVEILYSGLSDGEWEKLIHRLHDASNSLAVSSSCQDALATSCVYARDLTLLQELFVQRT